MRGSERKLRASGTIRVRTIPSDGAQGRHRSGNRIGGEAAKRCYLGHSASVNDNHNGTDRWYWGLWIGFYDGVA
jgi:hypothetical protein